MLASMNYVLKQSMVYGHKSKYMKYRKLIRQVKLSDSNFVMIMLTNISTVKQLRLVDVNVGGLLIKT